MVVHTYNPGTWEARREQGIDISHLQYYLPGRQRAEIKRIMVQN
jgi:hypothetical protein